MRIQPFFGLKQQVKKAPEKEPAPVVPDNKPLTEKGGTALPVPDFQATQAPNRCPFQKPIPLSGTPGKSKKSKTKSTAGEEKAVRIQTSEPVRYTRSGCGG